LHPRRDIHRLTKVVEPIVERDRDRGSPMHASPDESAGRVLAGGTLLDGEFNVDAVAGR
jgi:hypothetical protein